MSIDIKALRAVQDAQKTGNNLFMPANKEIHEDTIIRLVPPPAELHPLFYFERLGYWVNKKMLVSPATFGEHCIIEEYLDKVNKDIIDAEREGEPDNELKILYQKVKRKSVFDIPVLHLENLKYDGVKLVDYTVVSGKVRILQCGPQLRNAINAVVLSPALLRRLEGVKDLIFDSVKGYNISLSKSGKELNTTYWAKQDETCEIDAKYYQKVPSLVTMCKKQVYTDDYITAVLDAYFYGDPYPSDDRKVSRYATELEQSSSTTELTDAEDAKPPTRRRSSRSITPASDSVDSVEVTPKIPKRTSRRAVRQVEPAAPKERASERNLVDDMEDLDD